MVFETGAASPLHPVSLRLVHGISGRGSASGRIADGPGDIGGGGEF